jgi:hypothetical protein
MGMNNTADAIRLNRQAHEIPSWREMSGPAGPRGDEENTRHDDQTDRRTHDLAGPKRSCPAGPTGDACMGTKNTADAIRPNR